MLNNRFLRRTAYSSSRGGFTLVELLVVIGIIAILAGLALGPIANGIKQAQHSAAMQQAREVGQICFSFATDNAQNGNAYPADKNGFTIAQDLINSNYVSDPSVFALKSQVGYIAPTTSATTTAMTANACSWSFLCITTTPPVGINSNTSDLMPLVFFNNGFGAAVANTFTANPGTGVPVTYGLNAPFKTDGAAVFYKGNNAVYLKAGLATGGNTPTPGLINDFISPNCNDPTTYQIAQ
jgi:prepilin-type N-terminal cleavage/methylation domain-containing protein